jgi:hypothetical protein
MCAHHQGSGFSKMWRICALITSSCASTDARDNVSRTTCGVLVCATIDYLELRWSAPAAVRWRRRGATAQARKGRAADGGGEQAHCHERGARGHEPGAPHDRPPAGLGVPRLRSAAARPVSSLRSMKVENGMDLSLSDEFNEERCAELQN